MDADVAVPVAAAVALSVVVPRPSIHVHVVMNFPLDYLYSYQEMMLRLRVFGMVNLLVLLGHNLSCLYCCHYFPPPSPLPQHSWHYHLSPHLVDY